jgi:hypothetical protein
MSFSSGFVASENRVYRVNDVDIANVDSEKDIGVFMDRRLKFSDHCQKIANRANSLNFQVFRSFASRERNFLLSVFKIYVRPILEHDCQVWSPLYKEDILKIERPQRSFTKRLDGLSELSYLTRLKVLGEETLLVRRIKADLTLVYKIRNGLVHGLDDLISFVDSRTRGHDHRVRLEPFRVNARKNFFAVRIASKWNSLPHEVVNAKSLSNFKANLRKVTFDCVNREYFE